MLRYVVLSVVACFATIAAPDQGLATTYYVSSSGGVTNCAQSTPCSLSEGINRAGTPGDVVLLLNGEYLNQELITAHNGVAGSPITIKAQSKWGAILRKGSGNITTIQNNHLVIGGIVFDMLKTGGGNGGVRFLGGVHDVIVEDCKVEKAGRSGFHIGSGTAATSMAIYNLTIRNNVVDGTGYAEEWGEAFYIGVNYTNPVYYNLQVYGNTARDFTDNGIDIKDNVHSSSFHDNKFYDQVLSNDHNTSLVGANDGTISVSGRANRVYNNVVYNCKSGMGQLLVAGKSSHEVYNNVFYNSVSPSRNAFEAGWWAFTANSGVSKVYNNTFFNMVTHGSSNPYSSSDLVLVNNLGLNATTYNIGSSQLNGGDFVDVAAGDFRLRASTADPKFDPGFGNIRRARSIDMVCHADLHQSLSRFPATFVVS